MDEGRSDLSGALSSGPPKERGALSSGPPKERGSLNEAENASANDRVRELEDLYRRLEAELEGDPDQAGPPRH